MEDDDRLLDELADAILDGAPIRWADIDAATPGGRRDLVDRLKVLSALADVHRDVIPARWGHLTILAPLGRGAFGQVFRARDTRLDREVALKLISADAAPWIARTSAIIEEGRLQARIRHPNVVAIYGADRIGDQVGLWMELVEGRTLEQLLARGRRFTPAEVVDIGEQLCGAVDAVHSAGLLHRDIKPHNVMLSDAGRVVLMDFGTGWNVKDSWCAVPAGTPLYLAPELINDGTPTIRTDVYAIGVLLFRLLADQYPFRAHDLNELKRAHATKDRVDLRTVRPDVPSALGAVIDRAIDPLPEARYQTAAAMAESLVASRHTVSTSSWATFVVLAAVVCILVAFVASQRRSGEPLAAGTITPVTSTPGQKLAVALSPDGTRVAFVWRRNGTSELHVSDLSTGRTRQLKGAEVDGNYPAWSPDGRSVAFYRRFFDPRGVPTAAVRITPLEGGEGRTLWQNHTRLLGHGLSWSPDGQHLALSVKPSFTTPFRIMLLDVNRLTTQWLTSPAGPQVGDGRPVFSPDGRLLAFVRSSEAGSSLHVVQLATGEARRIDTGRHDIRDTTWSDEGRALIFTSYRGGGRDTLWRISLAGGRAQRLAGIGEGASYPSAAGAGGRLVYVQHMLDSNLYRADLAGEGGAFVRVVASSMRADTSPDIAPDGTRIAFASNRTGPYEIWLADSDGGNLRQLTTLGAICKHPRWSPDGRRIAFVVRSGSQASIYVADAATGTSRRITSGATHGHWPTWSADGQSIYFASTRSGEWQIWRMAVVGGEPVQVTDDGGLKAWESSDGSLLYYSNDRHAIWRMPARGGTPTLALRLPDKTSFGGEWILRSNGAYWLNEQSARPAIEWFDFSTGRRASLIVPTGPYDFGSGFSVSTDGRWAVFSQMDYLGADVMVIDRVR